MTVTRCFGSRSECLQRNGCIYIYVYIFVCVHQQRVLIVCNPIKSQNAKKSCFRGESEYMLEYRTARWMCRDPCTPVACCSLPLNQCFVEREKELAISTGNRDVRVGGKEELQTVRACIKRL